MRAAKLLTIFAVATLATAANAQGIDWQKSMRPSAGALR